MDIVALKQLPPRYPWMTEKVTNIMTISAWHVAAREIINADKTVINIKK